MSKFYTNVIQYGSKILVRGKYAGERFDQVIKYKPKHYVLYNGGKYKPSKLKTLNDQQVCEMNFDSIKEAKEFVEMYKEVDNFPVFGFNRYAYTYIRDNYPKEIDYYIDQISIVTLDIETMSDSGFPDIKLADKEITAITLRKGDFTVVMACGEYTVHKPNIKYIKCKDEVELLEKFIDAWKHFDPDIITGWNIEYFDVPYLVNRIARILGEDEMKRLSPWGQVRDKTHVKQGRELVAYEIMGIATIDYLQAYQKFTYSKQESYKLDYIALTELKEQKLDYSQYGSLHELFTQNFQKYIEYNIHDVDLVYKLNEKLGLIEQIIALAYMAKVNFTDAFTSVLIWDVIIHNFLLDHGIVVPTNVKREHKMKQIMGAYVKPPLVGEHKWVVSFDLNSLYPHLIMQYNISPETVHSFDLGVKNTYADNIEKLIAGLHKQDERVTSKFAQNLTMTPNGVFFRKDKRGFLPQLMENMYNSRVEFKNKMIAAKKANVANPSKELANEISKSHNMQMALKILLNSAYGALSNEWFRYFSINLAEGITYSGQYSIMWIEHKINAYINKILKTDGVDYVIASDTDSLYMTFESFVNKFVNDQTDTLKIVRMLDTLCKEKIEPFIHECYEELARDVNAYEQKMFMKRENIANKGIWLAKKKYILNVWNEEGVEYKEPKLKLMGVEAIKSSTPSVCRVAIKDAISIIMNKDQASLIEYIENFRTEHRQLKFEDVAKPSGCNGLNEYADSQTIYKKGTPIHVRGSLLYNDMIKKKGITNKYPQIMNGDKIKFCYLKMPNPIRENVISTAGELPVEFNLEKYIDYDMMFDKTFIESVKSITEIINWELEKRSTLSDFFM